MHTIPHVCSICLEICVKLWCCDMSRPRVVCLLCPKFVLHVYFDLSSQFLCLFRYCTDVVTCLSISCSLSVTECIGYASSSLSSQLESSSTLHMPINPLATIPHWYATTLFQSCFSNLHSVLNAHLYHGSNTMFINAYSSGRKQVQQQWERIIRIASTSFLENISFMWVHEVSDSSYSIITG